MKTEFVHLHAHSEYSLLDGTARYSDHRGEPSELLKTLARQGRAVAMTDHGNLFGAVEFYTQCVKTALKPIVGSEVYVAKGSRTDRTGSRRDNCHLTLLARDLAGYQNLMALVSKAHLEGFYCDPRIDKELLASHSKGLIALSGCLKSEVAQAALSGDLEAACRLAVTYRDLLEKGSFFLEIMDHGLDKQRQVLKVLVEVSRRTGIPLVATNDCHYARKSDWDAHDARVCIQTGKLLSDEGRLKFETHEFYYKTPEEMAKLFDYAPEAVRRTLEVAEMCHLAIPMDQILLPHFPVPAGFDPDNYLEKLCRDGLQARRLHGAAYEARLAEELSVIKRMGFSGYFLIVHDFTQFAKKEGIPVGPGRGSGAGSLVSYALGITGLDPIQHKLLFERFLNPDRRSMPDLDIDFSNDGRERVIEYVRRKYGQENVAQIITFSPMASRAAVRDVGRVLNVPLSEVDRLAKAVPQGMMLYEALQKSPDLKEAAKEPKMRELLDLAQKLEGVKRHTSVHAAGTVIAQEAVVRYTPLYRGPSDVVTTQYDGDGLQKLGVLKIDFLGLRTLSVLDETVKVIRSRKDTAFDLARIPMDDPKTFQLLKAARVIGVFQLEKSEGMRDLLRKLKPTAFEDIVALLALYRPGPIRAGMLDDFVARKHGLKKVEFPHPLLEPILKDTYGTIVYQEQVMQIAKSLGGFTPGQADGLRKAMGKKIPEEMEQNRSAFVEGCAAKKIPSRLANKIFDTMATFGEYGFNRSHSVAYAMIAYQTAYLKANHPLEFMTAALSSEIGHSAVAAEEKENKLVLYIDEVRAMGLSLLPPDVQRSETAFSIEGENGIRFGLLAVKNVGRAAAESIVGGRGSGPFGSTDDFLSRVDLKAANRKAMESLIKAGALDSLGASGPPEFDPKAWRGALLAVLEEAMARASRIREDLAAGQGQLFAAEGSEPRPAGRPNGRAAGPVSGTARGGRSEASPTTPGAESGASARTFAPHSGGTSVPHSGTDLPEHELLRFEKEVLGFYLSGHPLLRYKEYLGGVATHTIQQLKENPHGGSPRGGKNGPLLRLAGLLTGVKRLITKRGGEAWARADLEDLTGEIQLLVFPKRYEAMAQAKLLKVNSILLVTGRLSFRGEGEPAVPELIVEDWTSIDAAIRRFCQRLTVSLETLALEDSYLERLRSILARHPGACPVDLVLHTPAHGTTVVETSERVSPTRELMSELERLLGNQSWRIENASSSPTTTRT